MEKYVIIQNTGETPKEISDPRGTMLQLTRAGTNGDAIKVVIDDKNEDVYNLAVRKYNNMRNISGLRITFSENVNIQERKQKMIVTSTAEQEAGTAKRADVMRQQIKDDIINKNRLNARLARARAQAELNKDNREADLPKEEATPISKKLEKANKKLEKANKIQRQAKTDDDTELLEDEALKGTPVTTETLSEMTPEQLTAMGKDIGVTFTAETTKEEMIRFILKKLEA